MSETIYYNGKKYDSVAEMPASVRQNYEKISRLFADANQDGIPDIVQPGGLSGLKDTFNMIKELSQIGQTEGMRQEQFSLIRVTDTGIQVNGRSYNSVEEMPAQIRKEYHRIINNAQEGQVDIFDEPWREIEREDYFKPHDDEILNPRIRQTTISQANVPIETVDTTNRFLVVAAIAILVFGCMAVAWILIF
jgi:hypothetical protein